MGKTRILIAIDSTWLPKASKEYLLMDVQLYTMPLATIHQMCQIIVAMYQFIPGSHNSTKLNPPDTVVISNFFDHLAAKGILNAISNADEPVNVTIFAQQVKD